MQTISTKEVTGSREKLSIENRLFASKRKNVLQHLQGLLAKRARLTQEILFLKKSEKEKTQNYRSRVKTHLQKIKESSILCEDGFDQEVELSKILLDLDASDEVFEALLTSYSTVEIDHRFDSVGLRTIKSYTLNRADYKSETAAMLAESSIFFSGTKV